MMQPKLRQAALDVAAKVSLLLSLLVYMGSEAQPETLAPSQGLNLHVPADLPANLTNFNDPPGSYILLGVYLGIGAQEYTYNGTEWVNTNVMARLVDDNNTKVGHHFFLAHADDGGGKATWSYLYPTSSVTATAIAKVPQPAALPLLLLHATSTSGEPIHQLGFSLVSYVQRLETRGGLPPAQYSINASIGQVSHSRYTAIYAFYTPAY